MTALLVHIANFLIWPAIGFAVYAVVRLILSAVSRIRGKADNGR